MDQCRPPAGLLGAGVKARRRYVIGCGGISASGLEDWHLAAVPFSRALPGTFGPCARSYRMINCCLSKTKRTTEAHRGDKEGSNCGFW